MRDARTYARSFEDQLAELLGTERLEALRATLLVLHDELELD